MAQVHERVVNLLDALPVSGETAVLIGMILATSAIVGAAILVGWIVEQLEN